MGVIIKSAESYSPFLRFIKGSTIKNTTIAANKCLTKSSVDSNDLELVIFAGIYREKHIAEPSIASIIQKNIGANLKPKFENLNEKSTFSFDLNNGGCSFLTGIETAYRFISNQKVKYALIVAGDVPPFMGLNRNYNIKVGSSAILLSNSSQEKGFSHFKSYSFPKYLNSYTSFSKMQTLHKRKANRNILSINQENEYADQCLKCINYSVKDFLKGINISLEDIDIIISSQNPNGIAYALNKMDGFSNKVVLPKNNSINEYHTASIGNSITYAWKNQIFQRSKKILFIAVGSGITVSLSLYQNDQ